MTELSREDTPRVEALIDKVMADNPRHTAYAQAKYYEEVHQHLAPLARDLERELRAERAVSDRLLEALKFWKIAADNAEECEFDDMAAFSIPMPLFCDADEATDAAIAEVEAMRKEKPE